MKIVRGMIVAMVVMMSISPAFADEDYRQQNVFNRVTDWSVTFWRSPEDRDRIVNQRMDIRAQRRQAARNDKNHDMDRSYHEDQQQTKQDHDLQKDENNH